MKLRNGFISNSSSSSFIVVSRSIEDVKKDMYQFILDYCRKHNINIIIEDPSESINKKQTYRCFTTKEIQDLVDTYIKYTNPQDVQKTKNSRLFLEDENYPEISILPFDNPSTIDFNVHTYLERSIDDDVDDRIERLQYNLGADHDLDNISDPIRVGFSFFWGEGRS